MTANAMEIPVAVPVKQWFEIPKVVVQHRISRQIERKWDNPGSESF